MSIVGDRAMGLWDELVQVKNLGFMDKDEFGFIIGFFSSTGSSESI